MITKYLYQGKIYTCSEVTTEGELYGADTSWGCGKTLLFLDELEGGNYVNADDCVQVSVGGVKDMLSKLRSDLVSSLALPQKALCHDVEYEDF
jgi:hypothetical protein